MNQLRCDPINDEEVAKVLPPADESSIHSLHPNKFDSEIHPQTKTIFREIMEVLN